MQTTTPTLTVSTRPIRSWTRRWLRRALWTVGVIGLVGVLAVGGVAAMLLHYGSQDRAQAADVIIVLSGAPAGTERRARHAAELYKQGYAPYILCSGTGSWNITEARRCARRAESRGVPSEAIILEETSRSTEENAIESAAIMAARGWESAVLVSDNFHLWRANWLFEEQGVTAWPSPAQITSPLSRTDTAKNLVREVAAVGWQVTKSLLGLPVTRVD